MLNLFYPLAEKAYNYSYCYAYLTSIKKEAIILITSLLWAH